VVGRNVGLEELGELGCAMRASDTVGSALRRFIAHVSRGPPTRTSLKGGVGILMAAAAARATPPLTPFPWHRFLSRLIKRELFESA
jgi:hypothetical protein